MSRAGRRLEECARLAPAIGAREGELSAEESRAVEAHLAGCEGCRVLAAELEATDGLLAEALLARAGRRDFAPFVDGVMERVAVRASTTAPGGAYAQRERNPAPSERDVPARERGGWLSALLGWARAHRAAAFAGTLAPTVAGVALIVYLSGSGAPGLPAPLAGDVEVVAEGFAPMVLQTSDGPVVLLGDAEPGT